MKTCDVIIPTYNVARVIPQTLAALWPQTVPAGWSVRVVLADDGSTDDTRQVIKKNLATAAWPTLFLPGEHAGPAVTRNRALSVATGELVLFLGADILLRPNALATHLQWHTDHPQAEVGAVGMIRWDPRLRPTSLMEWMMHGGPQNNFDDLLGRLWAEPAQAFYGAQASLKRSFLGSDRFATTFQGYGWEDLELGRRLQQRGLRLRVLHTALGLHHHFYSVSQIAHRQQQAGRGLVHYQRLYPAATLLARGSRRRQLKRVVWVYLGLFAVLRLMVRLVTRGNRATPRLFMAFCTGELWRGALKVLTVVPINRRVFHIFFHNESPD
jgi:glycosyltransferase involved in cell wall biosynthesis